MENKKPGVRGKDKKPRRKTEAARKAQIQNAAKAREYSSLLQAERNNTPSEYNANTVSFLEEIMPKEPLDKTDVEEMQRRFMHYIKVCAERGMKISNQAAYMAIGITKDDVYDWENRSSSNPARTDFLKKVKQFCAVYREKLMIDGQVNNIVGIFWQKNYDGLRDQTELAIAPVNPLGEGKSAEELAKKYSEDAYIDAEEQKALPDKQKDDTAN